MRDVVIAPAVEGKGRSFQSTSLAYVEADLLWPGGLTSGDNIRPVWAMFAGSDQEMRAFVANLQMGRKASFLRHPRGYSRGKEDRMEFLKSAGYQTIWQREEEGSLVTVFLPDLFQIDPGMVDPMGIKFVLLPTREWNGSQDVDPKALIRHVERLKEYPVTAEWVSEWAPVSFLFASYLDRRTRCPLVADGRFFMQLMLACLKRGAATFSGSREYWDRSQEFGAHKHKQYFETDTGDVGLLPGIGFSCDHESFEQLLAQEVALFFQLTRGGN